MEASKPTEKVTYHVYRRRWLYLFVIFSNQVLNDITWISFSPVASYVAQYYDVSLSAINLQMTIFMAVHFVVTPVVIWGVDHWSFRWVLVLGSVLCGLGMAIKGISTWDAITPPDWRYTLTLVGSLISAVSQPMTMMVPTRYSQTWHPAHERTMATAVACMAAPVGSIVAISATPLFVRSPSDVPLINTVWAIPALVSAGVAVVGVTRSAPPTPPSASAACQPPPQPFFSTLKTLVTRRAVLVLMVSIGLAIGLVNSFTVLLGQLLCTRGYSPEFIGLCGALMFGCALPGTLILSWIATKTKRLVETVSVGLAFGSLFVILLDESALHQNAQVGIAVGMSGVGFFGVGIYPLVLELGVEASYPADQTYSSSMMFLPGSIIGAALVPLSSALARPLSSSNMRVQTCSQGTKGSLQAQDLTHFLILTMALIVFATTFFIVFFRTAFHRTNKDRLELPTTTNNANGVSDPCFGPSQTTHM